MLPRPSTTISLACCSARMVIDPSGSWRRSLSPVTSSRPSGSQSIEYPFGWLSGSLVNITSGLPSRPTATTCRSILLQNHSRPLRHRGDSGIPRPLSRTFGLGMTSPRFIRPRRAQARLLHLLYERPPSRSTGRNELSPRVRDGRGQMTCPLADQVPSHTAAFRRSGIAYPASLEHVFY